MKKLLVLLTAPLTMTACIDLTEPDTGAQVPGQNPGSDAETEDKIQGVVAVRDAYINTSFVQPIEVGETLSSFAVANETAVVNTGVCSPVDSLLGNFNSTASLSTSGKDILESRFENVDEGDLKGLFENDEWFFKNIYDVNGWDVDSIGHIKPVIDDTQTQATIDFTSNEYITESWNNITNKTVVRIKEGLTQVQRVGTIEDVIDLTDTIKAHRMVNSSGFKSITVFNTSNDSYYEFNTQNGIDTGTDCYTAGENFDHYIDLAKNIEWINSSYTFDNVVASELFIDPEFDFTVEEIEAKLA